MEHLETVVQQGFCGQLFQFEQMDSVINRTANANGSVRIVGNNRLIADWFQRHFQPGDLVEANVQASHHILLLPRR